MPHEVKHLRRNHGLFLQADGYMDTEQCYTGSTIISMVWISGIPVWLHSSKVARSVGVAHGVVNVCCECLLCSMCVCQVVLPLCVQCVLQMSFMFGFANYVFILVFKACDLLCVCVPFESLNYVMACAKLDYRFQPGSIVIEQMRMGSLCPM